MQTVRTLFICSLLLIGTWLYGQDKEIVQNYINTYKKVAIEEMQRTGVPAAITLSQGIHETLAGTSDLVLKSNNHFGIKCKSTWTGESVSHDDDARGECFRKYASPFDSYKDHSDFLRGNQRYAFLFNIDPLDYEGWARGLKKAGYATNPKYPQIIIKLIEDYGLQDYTLIALGREPENKELLADAGTAPGNAAEPLMEDAGKGSTVPLTDAVIRNPVYPEGEFSINNTKVIYARQGTSFLSLAEQYHLSLSRLFEFNDMEEMETVPADRLIFLQRKRKAGSTDFHVVQAGESLYDIAQTEGIRLSMLLEYNQLQEFMRPAVGTQLYLKTKSPVRPALASTAAGADDIAFASNRTIAEPSPDVSRSAGQQFITHIVQRKETMYSIAKKYNVKINDLSTWNHLKGNALVPGQKLKIYK